MADTAPHIVTSDPTDPQNIIAVPIRITSLCKISRDDDHWILWEVHSTDIAHGQRLVWIPQFKCRDTADIRMCLIYRGADITDRAERMLDRIDMLVAPGACFDDRNLEPTKDYSNG